MILDGKIVAADIKQRLKEEINVSNRRPPHLVIITIGEDPASTVYVRNKIKACEEVGITHSHIVFASNESVDEVKHCINILNKRNTVDGIMVQLPLPSGYDERDIIDTIDPTKDVDGLTTTNIGRLRSGQPCLKPCTAQGIIDLCKYYNIELDGQNVTIIGRSNIVGKPLADLMMAEGATVTQCHSHTRDLTFHCCTDIVVSAVGKPKMIGVNEVWTDTTVIDVGINRDENGKLCGDVDFEAVKDRAEHITPVPGGVGPMTVVELLRNTVEAWKNTEVSNETRI